MRLEVKTWDSLAVNITTLVTLLYNLFVKALQDNSKIGIMGQCIPEENSTAIIAKHMAYSRVW